MNESNMEMLFINRFFDDKEKYLIVIAFWRWMLYCPNKFKERMHNLSQESGYHTESVGCYFSNIFESPDEEGYFEKGVGFYGFEDDDEIVIDYAMFVKCAELAYSIYSENYGKG